MKNISRKYVDLIRMKNSRYPNWDPLYPIKVGDFGTVNRETGGLNKEGNIYEDPEFAEIIQDRLPVTDEPQEQLIMRSVLVVGLGLESKPDMYFPPDLAKATIKGQWNFGHRRSGLIILAKPQLTHMPEQVLLNQLHDHPRLEGKVLVTEVWSCPAYLMYLSNTNEKAVRFALLGEWPSADSSEPAEQGLRWWSQNAGGILRHDIDKDGDYVFTPLYCLRGKWTRGVLRREIHPPDPISDDLWVEVSVPWEPLDDEGEEVPFADTIFWPKDQKPGRDSPDPD